MLVKGYIKAAISGLLLGTCIISSGCATNKKNSFAPAGVDPMSTESISSQGEVKKSENAEENAREISYPVRPGAVVTLGNALQMAANYSWTMKVARGEVDVAQSRLDQAKAQYYPTLSAEINSQNARVSGGIDGSDRDFDDVAYGGVSLRYNVYDFGRRAASNAEMQHMVRAAVYAKQSEDLTVLFETANAYLSVQSLTESYNAASAYIDKITQLNETIRQSVQGGISPESDAVRGRLALSNAINRRKQIELNLSRAKNKLNALVGQEIKVAGLKKAGLPRTPDLEVTAVTASDANPAVLARDAALDGRRERVAGAKADYMPRIDVSGDYKRALESVDDLYDVSRTDGGIRVKFSFDIFDMSKKGKVSEAYAQVNVAQSQLGLERAKVNDQVRALLGDVKINADQWLISGEATKEANKTRDLYLEEFRLGDRNLSDLITAETEYFTAHTEAIDAKFGYLKSVFSIYYLAGKPREGLVALKLLDS